MQEFVASILQCCAEIRDLRHCCIYFFEVCNNRFSADRVTASVENDEKLSCAFSS